MNGHVTAQARALLVEKVKEELTDAQARLALATADVGALERVLVRLNS